MALAGPCPDLRASCTSPLSHLRGPNLRLWHNPTVPNFTILRQEKQSPHPIGQGLARRAASFHPAFFKYLRVEQRCHDNRPDNAYIPDENQNTQPPY
jgi:hypothetical protein